MSLSNWPDFLLIKNANLINGTKMFLPKYYYSLIDIGNELQSRQPPPREPEYDADGNIIISEVIGYDESGNEIWVTH